MLQGNCSSPPPSDLVPGDARDASAAQPLLPLRPQQCLILLDSPFLRAPASASLWLDGLYLRLQRNSTAAGAAAGAAAAAAPVVVDVVEAAEPGPQHAAQRGLWLTETVVQGDWGPGGVQSRRCAGGLRVEGSRVLADRALLPRSARACDVVLVPAP